MPQQDTIPTKERILAILRRRGPSLPVHVAREMEMSMLFAGAFLSELLSEKKIKISFMRVGSSPLYFIAGQEPSLKKFSQYLGRKEKETYTLLETKKFFKDTEQEPAIRVALRSIKDFAVPFKKNDEIYWRFFTEPEENLEAPEKPKITKIIEKPKDLEILEKPAEKKKKTIKTKTVSKKTNEKFFEKVKDFLSSKSIEITDIINFNKNELILKVLVKNKPEILIAYNKKRITETDIVRAHLKASEFSLNYVVLSLAEPAKKLKTFLEAAQALSAIGKIE
ncbi:MAG: hypothetical protein KJ566_03445 [Nanoarchaeota archaeon]|nr:hypothetical protein [Nanoarchaeota archaeon]